MSEKLFYLILFTLSWYTILFLIIGRQLYLYSRISLPSAFCLFVSFSTLVSLWILFFFKISS
jgi:hypothetical protein